MQGNNFKSGELTIYTKAGNELTFSLDMFQCLVIIKVLGIRFEKKNEYSCYPEEFLRDFMNGKINPFKLVDKGE